MLFCLFVNVSVSGHDVKISIFELQSKNNFLEFSMQFDKKDLAKAICMISPIKVSEHFDNIQDYLASNLSLHFNDEKVQICFTQLREDEYHVKINAMIYYPEASIKTIKVVNTCLIDIIDENLNIVNTRLYNKFRSFRMDKERTSIFIEY